MTESAPRAIAAIYFDGSSGAARPVELQLAGGALQIIGDGVSNSVPLHELDWPERNRHGMRVLHLRRGGSLQCADAPAWDAWCDANGQGQGLVSRLQGSWRWVAVSLLMLVGITVATQRWGIPLLADAVVAATPTQVDAALGKLVLDAVDQQMMRPSRLPEPEQQRVRAAFEQLLQAQPTGSVPPWELVFRRSRIGPNALALPGGTLIMTDELLALVEGDTAVLVGVLAHELGHVRHRHGMHMLVQSSAWAGLSALLFSDFSTLFAGVPVLLGNASYSRTMESEADRESVRMLQAAGISPLVMVRFFEALARMRGDATSRPASSKEAGEGGSVGIGISSHPADADRIRYFTRAAAGTQASGRGDRLQQ